MILVNVKMTLKFITSLQCLFRKLNEFISIHEHDSGQKIRFVNKNPRPKLSLELDFQKIAFEMYLEMFSFLLERSTI